MKNIYYVVSFLALLLMGFTVQAQVYKTADDTVKLNKEFIEVSNDIANLTAKLTVAQNNLPGYKSKAEGAESDAQKAAEKSSDQAFKNTGSSVKEAKKAKRDSKKALREAKDARKANSNVGDQDDKIASLKGQLAKKEERLRQLTEMREAIYASIQKY